MKKVISIFLSLLLVLSSVSIPVYAKDDNIDYISYEEIKADDKIDDCFADIQIDTSTSTVYVDGEESTLDNVIELEKEEEDIISSKESTLEYFDNEEYNVKEENDIITITNPYQQKRIIVLNSIDSDYEAFQIAKINEDITLLEYETIEDTMKYFEILKEKFGEDKVFLDNIIRCSNVEPEFSDSTVHNSCIDSGLSELSNKINESNISKNTVKVGIIDSGINPDVSEIFTNRVNTSLCKSYINEDESIINPSLPSYADYMGHGTTVSSIIASATPQNVEIVMYKIFTKNKKTDDSALLMAYVDAYNDGMDIINCSLSSTGTNITYADTLLEKFYNNNILVVCAAGNVDSSNPQLNYAEYNYPGCSPYTISVSSIDGIKNNNGKYKISKFSCCGEPITFSAFGSSVDVIDHNGNNMVGSGTSYACPLQTSEFAIIETFENDLTVPEYINVMKKFISLDFKDDYMNNNNYKSTEYGYGYCDFDNITLCTENEDDCHVLWHDSDNYINIDNEKVTVILEEYKENDTVIFEEQKFTKKIGEEFNIEDPVVTGYTFKGWYDNKNNRITLPFVVSDNIKLKPVFNSNDCNIILEYSSDTQNIKFTLKGYYGEYFTKENLLSLLTTNTTITFDADDYDLMDIDNNVYEDITLTEGITLYVTPKSQMYDLNIYDGENFITTIQVPENYEFDSDEIINKIDKTLYEKEHYDFAAFKDENNNFIDGNNINSNLDIYLYYTPKTYTLSLYDKNNNLIDTYEMKYNDIFDLDISGEDFDYWMDDNGNKYTKSIKIEHDTNLYYNTKKCTISFSEIFDDIIVNYGDEFELPDGGKDKYWVLDDQDFNVGDKITVTKNLHFVLKEIIQYKITLYNENTTSEFIVKIKDNNKIVNELPKPTKDGYSFLGWYPSKTSTNKITNNNILSNFKNNKNTTLYARFKEKEFTIKYNLAGGINNKYNPIKFKYGKTKTLFKPSKKGYLFNGWYTSATGGTQVTKIDQNKNYILYARWTKLSLPIVNGIITNSIDADKVVLSWNKTNADRYVIQYATKEDFSNYQELEVSNYKNIQLTKLEANTTYYLRIYTKRKDSTGKQFSSDKFSNVITFTTTK